MSKNSEWKHLLDAAHRAEWKVRKVHHGFMLYPQRKDRPPVVLGGTPSDHRALRNAVCELRRAGLNV